MIAAAHAPASAPKIALLYAAFGPYHAVRARAASLRQPIIAIEGSSQDSVHDWGALGETDGFQLVTLFPDGPVTARRTREVRARVFAALDEHRPDVLAVPGWAQHYALAMLEWARRHRVPAIMMSDSQEIDYPRTAIGEWIKRRVVRTCSAALVAGRRHIDYVEKLGLPRAHAFTGYDVVDNDHFSAGAARVHASGALSRIGLSLPEHYFLASARFVVTKNLGGLIHAYASYRRQAGAQAWSLVILGDGELRGGLEGQITQLGLGDSVILAGYKSYDELPAYYGLAGAFVHVSTTEQWGLVVNEAMAAGLPVIVSERCGCAPELVEDGANGYIIDPFKSETLVEAMTRIASPECDRAAMAARSREIIAQWGPEKFANGLEQAARIALDNPHKGGALDGGVLWLLSQLK
ncbi:MAG: glycosyltransferase family 4 protein [Hyphomonadaceae bacterium]|nr:glycosyltransferase family 4 protein [Hyphomonadaceae bacterium]